MASRLELLHAIITVGRSKHGLFPHPHLNTLEYLSRCFLLEAYLESAPLSGFGQYSAAFHDLDPTEKGQVSYRIGMTYAKLLAARLHQVPWLLHLDRARSTATTAVKLSAASRKMRPDLIGLDVRNRWFVFEAKGRSQPPSSESKTKAVAQAKGVYSINGKKPLFKIASITAPNRHQQLITDWIDPDDSQPNASELLVDEGAFFEAYYQPLANLVAAGDLNSFNNERFQMIEMPDAGLRVGLHERIIEFFRNRVAENIVIDRTGLEFAALNLARRLADQNRSTVQDNFFIGLDGIIIASNDNLS